MNTNLRLPPAEKTDLRIGYMRLTDSAPLIIAKELGFFAGVGLEVKLVREVSWANLRDRLVMGDLDSAQLLAPLPMMTSYGAGGIRAQMLTGLSLSLNGNAITLSNSLFEELNRSPQGSPAPVPSRQALRQLRTVTSARQPLTLATVHLFSMHTLLLRMWLQAGGINPDADVRIIVLPPEQMCDSLARGVIDGYCVGEPWNTLAVLQGTGSVISTGYDIWNNAPEKVLGVMESWHSQYTGAHLRLRVALMQAGQYLADPGNRVSLAALLSRAEYLNLPEKFLLPSLTGRFQFTKSATPVAIPDFHVFGKYHAGFPWRSHAEWIIDHCAQLLAKPMDPNLKRSLMQQTYRTDLYREAARCLQIPAPSRDFKTEDTHDDCWKFEPGIALGADRQVAVLT